MLLRRPELQGSASGPDRSQSLGSGEGGPALTDKNMHQQIDVEEAFDVVIRRLGGKRYSDVKSDTGNLPKNADYVIAEWNVIAELKQLKENLVNSRELKRKIGILYSSW